MKADFFLAATAENQSTLCVVAVDGYDEQLERIV